MSRRAVGAAIAVGALAIAFVLFRAWIGDIPRNPGVAESQEFDRAVVAALQSGKESAIRALCRPSEADAILGMLRTRGFLAPMEAELTAVEFTGGGKGKPSSSVLDLALRRKGAPSVSARIVTESTPVGDDWRMRIKSLSLDRAP